MKKKTLLYFLCGLLTLSYGHLQAQNEVRFPYPRIPDMITIPEARLDFLLQNFWENYQWADTTQTNLDVAEQGFSDFIFFLGKADSSSLNTIVEKFLSQAFQTPWWQMRFEHLIDHYFYNPNSPLRNDAIYLVFLRQMAPWFENDLVKKEQIAYRLTVLNKNLPGHAAHDFEYITRAGDSARLYDIQSEYTLIFFNDPDCERCQKTLHSMEQDTIFRHPRLKVLCIYPEADTENWKQKPHALPEGWTDACSPQGVITAQGLYHIPAMPSLYLLDKQKQVILKDSAPATTAETLRKLLNP